METMVEILNAVEEDLCKLETDQVPQLFEAAYVSNYEGDPSDVRPADGDNFSLAVPHYGVPFTSTYWIAAYGFILSWDCLPENDPAYIGKKTEPQKAKVPVPIERKQAKKEDEPPSYGSQPSYTEFENEEPPSYGRIPSYTEPQNDDAPSYGSQTPYTELLKDEPPYDLQTPSIELLKDEPPSYGLQTPSYIELLKDNPPSYGLQTPYTELLKDEPPSYGTIPSYTEPENDDAPSYGLQTSSYSELLKDEPPSYGTISSYTEPENDDAPSYGLQTPSNSEHPIDEPPSYGTIPSYSEPQNDDAPSYGLNPSYSEPQNIEPPSQKLSTSGSFFLTENFQVPKDLGHQLAVVPVLHFKIFHTCDQLPEGYRVATVQDVLDDKFGAREYAIRSLKISHVATAQDGERSFTGLKVFNLADGCVDETSFGLMLKRRNDIDHQLAIRPCMTIKLFSTGDQLPPQFRLATVQEVLDHHEAFLKAMPPPVQIANLADGCLEGDSDGGCARLERRSDVCLQLAVAPRVTFEIYSTTDRRLPPNRRMATVQDVLHQPRNSGQHWVPNTGWKIANLADGYVVEAKTHKSTSTAEEGPATSSYDVNPKYEKGESLAPSYDVSNPKSEKDESLAPSYSYHPCGIVSDEGDPAPSYGVNPFNNRSPYGVNPFNNRSPYGVNPFKNRPPYGVNPFNTRPPYGVNPFNTRPKKDNLSDSYGVNSSDIELENDDPAPSYGVNPLNNTLPKKDDLAPSYGLNSSDIELDNDDPAPAYGVNPLNNTLPKKDDIAPSYGLNSSDIELENDDPAPYGVNPLDNTLPKKDDLAPSYGLNSSDIELENGDPAPSYGVDPNFDTESEKDDHISSDVESKDDIESEKVEEVESDIEYERVKRGLGPTYGVPSSDIECEKEDSAPSSYNSLNLSEAEIEKFGVPPWNPDCKTPWNMFKLFRIGDQMPPWYRLATVQDVRSTANREWLQTWPRKSPRRIVIANLADGCIDGLSTLMKHWKSTISDPFVLWLERRPDATHHLAILQNSNARAGVDLDCYDEGFYCAWTESNGDPKYHCY